MNVEMHSITVRELTDGYTDGADEGVVAYGGSLDVRPPYQREFIYKDTQRDAVITTVRKNFPLNVMYWAVRADGGFEVIDGQQRTLSICQYVNGDFAHEMRYFHNLTADEQEKLLDYELMVYRCAGTDSEKLEWFKTINIAGEKLTDQELRNAVYAGSWVTDAKRYFSKRDCAAHRIAGGYMAGSPIRQEYLEAVIGWISAGEIEAYMATNQHKPDATALWLYFQKVIAWVKATFPTYRDVMKGVEWGHLYNLFHEKELDAKKLEAEVSRLLEDEDVTAKKGIYWYVLDGKEKHLNIRQFTKNQRIEAFTRQKGKCPVCKKTFEYEEMEADHITPWHLGGKTEPKNCQMLCKEDNRRKSGK